MELFLFGFFLFYFLIFFAVWIISGLLFLPIFLKAGRPWWDSFIPIWSTIILFQITKLPWWLIFLFVIPYAAFVIMIVAMWKLGEVFGKSDGFKLGLVVPFIGVIFILVLAFDDSRYIYAAPQIPLAPAPPAPPPPSDSATTF